MQRHDTEEEDTKGFTGKSAQPGQKKVENKRISDQSNDGIRIILI